MLWLVTEESSNLIVSCNLHHKNDMHSVWVERQNGKNMKVLESNDLDKVKEIRNAIDYAIETKEPTLDLRSN